jgi:hypothetical protein
MAPQRHVPMDDMVDKMVGRPTRTVIEDGRCVIPPNPNHRERRRILDSGTLTLLAKQGLVPNVQF